MNTNNAIKKSTAGLSFVIRLIESLENLSSLIIVLVIIISISCSQRTGDDTIDIIHKVGLGFFILKIVLFVTLKAIKSIKNKHRNLPAVISNIRYDKINNVKVNHKTNVVRIEDKEFSWKYAAPVVDSSEVATVESEINEDMEIVQRCNFLDNIFLKNPGVSIIMYNDRVPIASMTLIPTVNSRHYNNNQSEITVADVSSSRSHMLCVDAISISSAHVNYLTVTAMVALFRYHAATLIRTDDGTYTDIIIYARVNKDQEIFIGILKALGFIKSPSNKKSDKYTYTMKFSEQLNNSLARKIFESIHR